MDRQWLASEASSASRSVDAAPPLPGRAGNVNTAPQTPPRASEGAATGYKRGTVDVSPSSVFSSGRRKLNLPVSKDICPRCAKTIYHAEKVVGPGGPWHRACFKCKQCNSALSSTTLTEHDGEAFCRNCYTKLFSPRGYNIGGSTESIAQRAPPFARPRGASVESPPVSPTRRRESVAAQEQGSLASTYLRSSSPLVFDSAVAAAASAAVAAQPNRGRPATPLSGGQQTMSRPVSARSSTGSGLAYGRAFKPKAFGVAGLPPDICPRCNTTIYAAEMGSAAGRKYHKRCIRCKACNTALGSLQLTEREGEIYCKQCYARDFGPKGFRPSLGASINDY
ncbi:hypothetical protein H4R26_004200 [Coemansia thaxteri]|uniref:LIM zinc-binding domain-containing protein n=1 Tax=Coemansia thaxteri TaxID=2663907 RepID=A0A9W8BD66_9FUNG|nr:hypothetical protein H4R26_004200 [Coemansia thaxteri]KAJ2481048.1 hypothetical protein EV174_003572 [Coemansia sp. RSA 2320]